MWFETLTTYRVVPGHPNQDLVISQVLEKLPLMGRHPKNSTFDLIASLSATEKGFVRKALARPLGRRPGAMLALFDCLASARAASDEAITSFLRKQPGGGSQLKRLLFDSIVRTLAGINHDTSDRRVVSIIMQEALVLEERELFSETWERLANAYDRCERSHLFTQHVDVCGAMIRVLRRFTPSSNAPTVQDLTQRRLFYLRIAYDVGMLSHASSSLMAAIHAPDRATKAKEILELPIVTQSLETDHVRVRFWRHHVRAMANHFLGNYDQQDEELAEMVRIIEHNDVFLVEDVAITVMANVLTTHIMRRDTTSGRAALRLLRRLQTDSPRLLDELWYNDMRAAMYLDLIDGNAASVIAAEAAVTHGIMKHPVNGPAVYRTWRLLSASAYLQEGKPDLALATVRTLLDEHGLPETHYTAPRLIEILALIDAGDKEPALYRLRALERALKPTLADRPFMRSLLHCLTSIAKDSANIQREIDLVFAAMQNGVDHPSDRAHRVTTDIDRWLTRRRSITV